MLEICLNPNFVSICWNLILRPYNLFNILFLIKLNNKQFMAFIEILENIFGHFKFLQRGLKPNSTFVVGCVICRAGTADVPICYPLITCPFFPFPF